MSEAPYDLVQSPAGTTARIRARGPAVLTSPTINRGTAFTTDQRRALGLVGLLPSAVSSSPFGPVPLHGVDHHIAQANNALVFPGLGLGVTVARASRISERMIAAAADAVAHLSDASGPGAPLLPPMTDLRPVSAAVAIAVVRAAVEEGHAQVPVTDVVAQVHDAMWRPVYPDLEVVPS